MTQQKRRRGEILPNGQVFLGYSKLKECWGTHDELLKKRDFEKQLYRERRRKEIKKNALHGGAIHSWFAMKQRCSNPNQPGYAGVGSKGIKVCERWRDSFANFLADMGPRPTPKHRINRIDWKKDYKRGNCYWTTMRDVVQSRPCCVLSDSEMPKIINLWEQGMTQTELAKRYGITQSAVSQAIRSYRRNLAQG
jgi:hypothetical protein